MIKLHILWITAILPHNMFDASLGGCERQPLTLGVDNGPLMLSRPRYLSYHPHSVKNRPCSAYDWLWSWFYFIQFNQSNQRRQHVLANQGQSRAGVCGMRVGNEIALLDAHWFVFLSIMWSNKGVVSAACDRYDAADQRTTATEKGREPVLCIVFIV